MTAPVELQLAPSAGAPTPPTLSRERYGGASAQSQANFLAVARRDDRRGHGRDHLRHRRVIDRARGIRARFRSRGLCEHDHHLALHGSARLLQARRAPRTEAGRVSVLHAPPYVGVESIRALVGGEHADVSVVGMVLAGWSLATPLLGMAKQRIADQIGSAATKGEGRQNIGPGRRPPDRRRHREGRRRGPAPRGLLCGLAARRIRGPPRRVRRRLLQRRLITLQPARADRARYPRTIWDLRAVPGG